MMKKFTIACLAGMFALPTSTPLLADEETDDGVRDCISTSRLQRTKVVDDLNILFYMRGKTVYHSILPRRCRGLSREGRFSYRTFSG